MTHPAIAIDGLVKRYGRAEVLRGVSLSVGQGESLGLVGVNGAGKTTLVKCLLDFCGFDAGRITIDGLPHDHPDARAPLAYLPERFVPPYFATGHDFLAHMARLRGIEVGPDAVAGAAAALDLDAAALDRPVRALSKGMAQKLGLLAVLVSDRPIYLLDEPFSGLDPKARALLKRHLLAEKAAGRTLFFSTHALADVEALCERVAVLHAGRIAFAGPVAEFRAAWGAATIEEAYLRCVQ